MVGRTIVGPGARHCTTFKKPSQSRLGNEDLERENEQEICA